MLVCHIVSFSPTLHMPAGRSLSQEVALVENQKQRAFDVRWCHFIAV